jgi:hypothetical protein
MPWWWWLLIGVSLAFVLAGPALLIAAARRNGRTARTGKRNDDSGTGVYLPGPSGSGGKDKDGGESGDGGGDGGGGE